MSLAVDGRNPEYFVGLRNDTEDAAQRMSGSGAFPVPDDGKDWNRTYKALKVEDIVDISRETVRRENPDLVHLLDFPYEGQSTSELRGNMTPNVLRFVQNRERVPDIDEDAFYLEFGGLVRKASRITMRELKNPQLFPQSQISMTLQCNGGRARSESRSADATGTPVYRGVSLKRVLEKVCGGVLPECKHIEFIGADTLLTSDSGKESNYAVSIPIQKVQMEEDVLLVWEMNAAPLPKMNGFPLRVVVAGYDGSRSCKWVCRINALAEPSDSPVQRNMHDKKYPDDFKASLSSAVLIPKNEAVVPHDGKLTLKGWAFGGEQSNIEKVEVSPDGGHIWYAVPDSNLTEKLPYAWRLWSIEIPVNKEGWLELCVRAWDSSLNTQSESPSASRNSESGLAPTAPWHRIKIYSAINGRISPSTA